MVIQSERSVTIAAWLGVALALALVAAPPAPAVQTKVVKHNSFKDFSEGQLESTSLSSRGELTRAPAKRKRAGLGANLVFAMAADRKNRLYAATGDKGYIFRIEKDDTVTTLAKLAEPLVTALAIDEVGALYAATAPGGKIYRIATDTAQTTPPVFCATKEQYVWSMLVNADGSLVAATGKDGKILSISPKGEAEVLFDTDTKNVTQLLRTRDGRLLALTDSKCRVYEILGRKKARVLYEGKLDEGRAFCEAANGDILLAINSAPSATRFLPGAGPMPPLSQPTPPATESPTPPPGATPAPSPSPGASAPSGLSMPSRPGGQAIVIRLDRAGFANLLWMAADAPIHSMCLHADGESVIVGAGAKGKLYLVKPNGDYSILFGIKESLIPALLWIGEDLAIGAGDSAAIYAAFGPDASKGKDKNKGKGVFLSSAIDAGSPVKWGRLQWNGALADKGVVAVATRTGATAEPDDNLWNVWSKDVGNAAGAIAVESPIGRYFQYRLSFAERATPTDAVEEISVYFLPENRPPLLKSIKVASAPPKKSTSRPPTSGTPFVPQGTNPVLDRLLSSPPVSRAPGVAENVEITPFSNEKKKIISWEVSDPNEDSLEAEVYFKGKNESTWILIEEKVRSNTLEFQTSTAPDGEYRVRVLVHDRPANSFDSFSTTELISNVFLIDNTQPEISVIIPTRKPDGSFTISLDVADQTSLIYDAQFSVDGRDWEMLRPKDGLFDAQRESFVFNITPPTSGEHILAILVSDSEGNTVVKKLTLKP